MASILLLASCKGNVKENDAAKKPAVESSDKVQSTAEPNTPDLSFFGLFGKVKTCTQTSYWDGNEETIAEQVTYSFDEEGNFVSLTSNSKKLSELGRDEEGRIISVSYIYPDYDDSMAVIDSFTYNSDGRIIKAVCDSYSDYFGYEQENEYLGDRLLLEKGSNSTVGTYKNNYEYLEDDAHGNWTRCKQIQTVETSEDETVVVITREIEYWE